MASIGELISVEQRDKIIELNMHVGDVYRMKLTPQEGIIPKNKDDKDRNKYFIIIGKDDNGNAIGFVLINTHINPGVPQIIKDLHYPLKKDKYSFLENEDRFVDCSKLKEISKVKFNELFMNSKIKDSIKEDDMEYIIGALKSSPLIAPNILKRFGII